jgi:peptidoglycan hydrolase-like protein with peptidoglycan-binding domain
MESTHRVRMGSLLLVVAVLTGGALAEPADSTPLTTGRAATEPLRPAKIKPWHLAPSLAALRAEINSRWPGRSTASDGTLGDARHLRTRNSHNRVGDPTGPEFGTTGAVHALDITAAGIDTSTVLDAVIGDPRVWYVIFDGRIWSRTYGWAARTQVGDPHRTHIHISLRDGTRGRAIAAETDTSRWLPGKRASTPSRGVVLSTAQTMKLQRALIRRGYRIPSGPTGWYGPETTKAVRAFQSDQGWSGSAADGLAGRVTLARLGLSAGSGGSHSGSSTKKAKKSTKKAKTSKNVKNPKKAKKSKASKKPRTTKPRKRSSATRVYRPGNADPKIYVLQQALIARGYTIPAGPTGYFGTRTLAAVRAFQVAQGWADADGIPGRATLRRLGLG